MPKYFMSGTKYAAFERMMMEVPRPGHRQKASPREGKNIPFPKNEQATAADKERSE